MARLVVMLCLLALPASALADATVVVLGLRSVEGDDDIANALTEQVRSVAREVPGFQVSSAAVSMAQMSLAHGCDEIDAACLNEIARGLSADVVIYGTIRRNSTRADFDFAVNLALFDARAGQIVKAVDDVLPRGASPDVMNELARKLVSRLASTAAGGSIALQANVPDAEVVINDQPVGHTRDGALRLDGLQPGQYRVEIRKENYTPHMSTVTVVEGGDTAITAVLVPLSTPGARPEPVNDEEPAGGGHQLGWLGWTLIGVGAVSLAAMVVSMKVISDLDDDPLKARYADAVARGNAQALMRWEDAKIREMDPDLPRPKLATDVCDQAQAGLPYDLSVEEARDVADLCSTAHTMQVLQWVFGAVGVVGVGTGIVLVLTEDHSPPDEGTTARRPAEPAFAISPAIGPKSAGFTAQLRF